MPKKLRKCKKTDTSDIVGDVRLHFYLAFVLRKITQSRFYGSFGYSL